MCMLVREGFSVRVSWPFAGRYEALCAAGALKYTPVEPDLNRWTPRQLKAMDEALRRICLGEIVEGDIPLTNCSQWCGCTVTFSEGASFILTWWENPEDGQHTAVRLRHQIVAWQ